MDNESSDSRSSHSAGSRSSRSTRSSGRMEHQFTSEQMTAICAKEFVELIGSGNNGSVYKGQYKGAEVAVKVYEDQKKRAEWEMERTTLKTLRHNNIIDYIGCADVDKKLYLVTEYVSGELKIRDLDWSKTLKVLHGLASAVACLHAESLVHGDIKIDNILITKDHVTKLIDFGYTAKVGENVRGFTPSYVSPQISQSGKTKLSFADDIYSFGILILRSITDEETSSVEKVSDLWNMVKQTLITRGGRVRRNLGVTDTDSTQKKSEELLQLGLKCSNGKEVSRPTIKGVQDALDNIRYVPTKENKEVTGSSSKGKKKGKGKR